MTNTELIRQEIERLLSKSEIGFEDGEAEHGYKCCLRDLKDFIDSLPKEKHERLPKDIECIWYKDGECKKGLPGTKCDVIGCVARISKAENILINKRRKRVV